MHLAQELLMNIHCSGGLRSFAKEARALTVRSTVAGYRKLMTLNSEDHQNWSSYNYTRSCQRTQHQPVYSCLAFEANWKGEKAQETGTLWADHKKKKKKNHFEVSSSLILHNNNDFSIGLWHAMKTGFYTTTSNDQLSGWTEKKLQSTSQSQTCAQKRSWSLFSGLRPIWPTTAFWIPEKPLHLRCMLSELMRCTKNCKA